MDGRAIAPCDRMLEFAMKKAQGKARVTRGNGKPPDGNSKKVPRGGAASGPRTRSNDAIRRTSATVTSKQDDLARETEDPTGQFLTTNQGLRVNDDQNSLKGGERGPTLLEDFHFREKIMHFDHERIPERIVHARGAGAHGFFQVYEPMTQYTKAHFLSDPSLRTPVFVRFSTVAGSRGSTDLARDVRGFATKFYTEEGVYDLVGNNIPVFFIQDALKFPDVVHAVKPEPHHEMPQAASAHDTFWDFISLMPESMHMIMWVMSDRAIPRSFRMMEGFGVHTFRLVNDKGRTRLVKFHWKPILGVHSVAWDEAQKISGKDPDFHRRDLWEAIENGDFPQWEFGVQIVEEKDELAFGFDMLDPTKLLPEELVPVRRIGRLTLDRNPDNFFAETEQIAFNPGNIVPGIDFSDDPLLQGRLFSYLDTQLLRLGGPNFHEIPINRPIAPVHNLQRDGHMRQMINRGRVSYEPNSLAGNCPFQAGIAQGGFTTRSEVMQGATVRARSRSFFDHFSQAQLFWNSQSDPEKDHLVNALRFELGKVGVTAIRERMVYLLAHVDRDLAERVGGGLGIGIPTRIEGPLNLSIPADANPRDHQPERVKGDVGSSNALSMADTVKNTIRTRKVAILVAEGSDGAAVGAMKKALEAEGAVVKLVAPHLGQLKLGREQVAVDESFLTASSVLYDAVYVPGGESGVGLLKLLPDAGEFVAEAEKHCKAIAGTGAGADFVRHAIASRKPLEMPARVNRVENRHGIILGPDGRDREVAAEFIAAIAKHRDWSREEKHVLMV
jgi:catalase